jgi:hypothetical protein
MMDNNGANASVAEIDSDKSAQKFESHMKKLILDGQRSQEFYNENQANYQVPQQLPKHKSVTQSLN